MKIYVVFPLCTMEGKTILYKLSFSNYTHKWGEIALKNKQETKKKANVWENESSVLSVVLEQALFSLFPY